MQRFPGTEPPRTLPSNEITANVGRFVNTQMSFSLRKEVSLYSLKAASNNPRQRPAASPPPARSDGLETMVPQVVGRIHHAKLFTLLTSLKIGRHFRLVLLVEQLVVKLQSSLVVARKLFNLLLHHWAGLNACLIGSDLLFDARLILFFGSDALLERPQLRSHLLHLRGSERPGAGGAIVTFGELQATWLAGSQCCAEGNHVGWSGV